MEGYEASSEDNDNISSDDYDDIFFRDDFDISVEDDYDVHKELVHCIDKKMPVSTIENTIENACRFIFAENVVSYIALEFHGLVFETRHYKKSDIFFNPFCETIKHAMRIIKKKIDDVSSSSFEVIGDLTKAHKLCYEIFVDAVLSHYSEKCLKAGQFFYFCVYFSELAAKCYRKDFEEVFEFAVYAILDGFRVYKGRLYELIDFAQAVVQKSDQTFNIENMVEIIGIDLEKLKVVDKSDICDNLLKLSISKNIDSNEEKELEKCRTILEQLNFADKYDRCDVVKEIECYINEIVEKLVMTVEFHVNNCNLSFCSRKCCISLMDKVFDGECKNVLYPTENRFLEEIVQEALSVVDLEASLFSAIYASPKNKLNFESHDDSHSTNTKDKIESICSCFQNIQVQDSNGLFKEFVPPDCIEEIVNNSISPNSEIAEVRPEKEKKRKKKSSNPRNTHEHADVKFPNGESKVFELDENEFVVQRSMDNKIKNATAELEKKSDDKGGIVEYNTTEEVEHNFIEKETEILKKASVMSNSEFKKVENEKASEEFNDTPECENLSFRKTELNELGTEQHSLICENPSENNSNPENFKQLECKNAEGLDGLSDKLVPVDAEDNEIVDFFAIYKSEGEVNEENLKVLKGDTILFAEDLVRYVMKEFHDISYTESKFDGIDNLYCNAFNETVKEVLKFIHDKSETLNRILFDTVSNLKENNNDCYRKYVAMVLSHYSEDGLNSEAFLYFCLHFSEMAAKFYVLEHPEILDFAICSILDAFCLLKDDWCEFKISSERLLVIFKTKTDDQCTGCKIHSYVDNFEKECVKAILDTLKTFLHEKIEDMFSNNARTVERVNSALSSKTLENNDKNVKNSQSYETEAPES